MLIPANIPIAGFSGGGGKGSGGGLPPVGVYGVKLLPIDKKKKEDSE